MCGIFGIIADPQRFPREQLHRSLEKLFLLSETRGKESSGIAVVLPDSVSIQKSPVRPKQLLKTKSFKSFVSNAVGQIYDSAQPFAIFGHSRLVTNGAQNIHANNQPVISGSAVGVHNGILVNDAQLWQSVDGLERLAEVDTEVLLQLISKSLSKGENLAHAVKGAFDMVVGTVSTAIAFDELDCVLLATNNGSLYTALDPQTGTLAFASERYILEEFLKNNGLGADTALTAEQVAADDALIVRLNDLEVIKINLDQDEAPDADINKRSRKILDQTPEAARHTDVNSAPKSTTVSLGQFDIDTKPIDALKRCTKCILPETVPYIEFDAGGVCNFCNSHTPKKYLGKAALEAAAEKLKANRTKDGTDCLFTLSGGRDSSFGLHYAVRELGLKPVTYTYDWGMITDLARRNQARMCGELKVEHILVSADITEKRANIRRNVSAWLKRPSLGMIPLFMAGDKQYFYFANDIGQKMGLETTVLASNPLEKTHFKAGFCGVAPTLGHRPSSMSQAKMASFYGRNFLMNPSYINRSLVDTMGAFASYYLIKHQYLRLFDYIPWIEEDVNSTLLKEYDWETAKDTNSTWRIGDGTAAFYNYIYYKVAGFSENDTFRSNQIREGMLDRESALSMSREENQPRFESIAWYCDVIGLDPVEVLTAISRISPLYAR